MRKHGQCKYFGYRTCAQADNEIMKRSNSDIPEYHGGKPQPLSHIPDNEEIDAICSICDKFTPAR